MENRTQFQTQDINNQAEQKNLRTYSFKPSLSGYKEKFLFAIILFAIAGFGIKYVLDNNILFREDPIFLGGAGFAIFIPFAYLSQLIIKVKAASYTLSSERLTIRRGITSRTVSNLELWRVTDVQYHQSAIQLIFGECYIEMLTKDVSDPVVYITGMTKAKGEKIYKVLNEYVAIALRSGGVMQTIR